MHKARCLRLLELTGEAVPRQERLCKVVSPEWNSVGMIVAQRSMEFKQLVDLMVYQIILRKRNGCPLDSRDRDEKGDIPTQTGFAHRSVHESIKEFCGSFSGYLEDVAREKTERLVEEALKAEIRQGHPPAPASVPALLRGSARTHNGLI